MALVRGQVVVMRRTGPAVIWWIGSSHVKVVPIIGCNGTPRHRADVRLSAEEITSCAAGPRYPSVRCRHVFEVTAEAASAAKVLGEAPDGLMQRMATAMTREAAARSMESRMHFGDRGSGFMTVLG